MPDLLPSWFIPAAATLIGFCIGSFLNVVIYRIPRGLSINSPKRSFCPHCHASIPWYHNLPVVSWLVLRGKCAYCKAPISFRYWVVEVLTGLLFAAIAYTNQNSSLVTLILLGVWVSFAIAIAFIDAEHMLVFPRHTLIATAAGLGVSLSGPQWIVGQSPDFFSSLSISVIGWVTGYIVIRLVIELGKLLFGRWEREYPDNSSWELREPDSDQAELTLKLPDGDYTWSELFTRSSDQAILSGVSLEIDNHLIPGETCTLFQDRIVAADGTVFLIEQIQSARGTLKHIKANREAMGYGDAWIMAMIGSLTGWEGVVFCLLVGSVIGIAVGLLGKYGLGKPMPFGPSLLLAAVAWPLGGYQLMDRYLYWLSYGI